MKQFNLVISAVLVVLLAFLCAHIIANSLSNQKNNTDYAELHNIKYGLLNVDEWKGQIKAVLAGEIDKIDLSRPDAMVLRKNIEDQLNALIDKIYNQVREANAKSPAGWFKQSFINIFVNVEAVKKAIPEYTDSLIHEMTRPRTKNQIKTILNKQLERYSKETFSPQDITPINRILARTNSNTVESARITLDSMIYAGKSVVKRDAVLMIAAGVIIFLLAGFSVRPLTPAGYIVLVLTLITLLAAGVTTPMINMEAKISQLKFILLGHVIHFDDQVLYFQSKSVLDVFWLLITDKAVQMKLVGVLIITFSVIFPLLKIISLLVYFYDFRGARDKALIRFFVFSSGKWSMADVMVVAIFMAYIGANGIIESQLKVIRSASENLGVLTMNGTALQPGYFLFLTYTLLALVLPEFLDPVPVSNNTSRC